MEQKPDNHSPHHERRDPSPDGLTPPTGRWQVGGTGGAMAGAGLQFAISILLFLYLGQWLDRRFGWTPWGTLGGVFLGAGAGFTSIYRKLMADLRREEEAKRRP